MERTPKKITVYRNGCWLHRHLVLLNKRLKFRPAEEFFEALLQDVGEMFKMKFTKLLAADDYREVKIMTFFFVEIFESFSHQSAENFSGRNSSKKFYQFSTVILQSLLRTPS